MHVDFFLFFFNNPLSPYATLGECTLKFFYPFVFNMNLRELARFEESACSFQVVSNCIGSEEC